MRDFAVFPPAHATPTRLANKRDFESSGTGVDEYSLTIGYAPDGDVASADDSVNGNWVYTYDGFNRIGTANKNNGQLSYTYAYDRYGNMWHGDGNLSVTFSGGNNRVDGSGYDASGNLLGDGNHSYTYDAEDRISKVDGGDTASYTYDALGHRVLKVTPSDSMNYVYDQFGHEVAEVHGSQTGWHRGDVYADGRHLAIYTNSTTYFVNADQVGTERARTGVSGALCETITSLPFGDGMSISGGRGAVSPKHFTGQMRDDESGNDYFGARYYGSDLPPISARPVARRSNGLEVHRRFCRSGSRGGRPEAVCRIVAVKLRRDLLAP